MALVIVAVVVVGVIDKPIWGVWLLLVTRLMSTGATVFLRIGRIGLGPFEPVLLFVHERFGFTCRPKNKIRLSSIGLGKCLIFASVLGFFVGLFWSADFGRGVSELLPLGIAIANTVVILTFVKSWTDFKATLWCWVLAMAESAVALFQQCIGT